MSRPVANQRLFVAAYPPHEIARAMIKSLRAIHGLPDLRETPLEQIHLTLQFIGDVAVKDLDRTIESIERAASGLRAFDLKPLRLISLPDRDVARLIACETDAPPEALELHRRLAVRLAHDTTREDAADRYRPHLTLARFRRPTRLDAISRDVSILPFSVDRILLVRSILRPRGAEHVPVREVTLAEGRRPSEA